MSLSQLRIIEGTYSVADLAFTLIIEVIRGMPVPGDGIMMLQCIWRIREVQKLPSGERYKVIATTNIRYLNDFNFMIEQLIGNDFLCDLDMDSYRKLSSARKILYFRRLASLYQFKQVSKFIREHIQLCIALFPDDKSSTIGLSKLGGLPNAPVHFTFPKDKVGKSALFIGQIDIDAFNQSFEATKGLNGDGILYFFGTIQIRHDTYYSFGEILVLYSENKDDLVEIPLPDDLKDYGIFEELGLFAVEEVSMPDYDSTPVHDAGFNEDEAVFYEECCDLIESYSYLQPRSGSYFDCIKLLGYPQQVQGCVQVEAVFKNLKQGWYNPDKDQRGETPEMINEVKAAALQWRHLFSLPTNSFEKLSNFPGEFNKCMDGIFNVMIRHVDLEKMDFNNTVSVYQST